MGRYVIGSFVLEQVVTITILVSNLLQKIWCVCVCKINLWNRKWISYDVATLTLAFAHSHLLSVYAVAAVSFSG